MRLKNKINGFRQSSAFTLVEIAVAIVIVAVLATLMLSGVRKIAAKGHDVKCVSNLRASGRAMLNYFQDNNGNFFVQKNWFQYPSYHKPTSNPGMRDYLGVEPDLPVDHPNLKVETILTCPAMTARYPGLKEAAFRRSYGVNYYLLRRVDSTTVPSLGNIRNVEKLSSLWMLADGPVSGGAAREDVSGLLSSINRNTAYAQTQFLPYPHGGRNHFVFFDGHVEGLTAEELRDRKDSKAFWGDTSISD